MAEFQGHGRMAPMAEVGDHDFICTVNTHLPFRIFSYSISATLGLAEAKGVCVQWAPAKIYLVERGKQII